jgi:2-O-methyltransferase
MNKQDIKQLINKEDPLVLDIGCYDGKDSLGLSNVLNCEVHCFEADPLSQDLFESIHAGNNKLFLYKCAVSNVDGEIDFYQSNHPQSNSIREPKVHVDVFPGVKFDEVTKVQSIRLDTWLRNYQLFDASRKWKAGSSHEVIIDFIWADVNGAEIDLLRGGWNALSKTRYLYIESGAKELYKGQLLADKIQKMLAGDFQLIGRYNWGENFGNLLFKNTKLCNPAGQQ